MIIRTRNLTDKVAGETEKTGAREFAIAAAELAYNTRCEDVVLLDLRGRSPVTEFVIATGSSPRQMRTVVEEIRDLGKKLDFAAWQTSGLESGRWILIDCVTVVCHVFDTEGRDFYDLELLWGDCPRIDWRKELGLPPATERPADRGGFHEASHLDQLDAQEREDNDLTEEEENELDADEDTELPVVVEIPSDSDESTGSKGVELVEIDPPGKRRKARSALYPTPIGEAEASEGESAVHVVTMREAAEASLDEDAVPTRKQAKKKAGAVKKAVAKKAVKKVSRKKAPAKKKVIAKKKPPAKKAAAKKKLPAKKKVSAKKKSPAKKKPTARKKPPAKKKSRRR